MFRLHPVFIAVLAAQGMLFPAAQSWSATLKPYTPQANDNKAGVFCVCNGSTQTLSGLPQFAPGESGAKTVTLGELQGAGRIIDDFFLIDSPRVDFGAQNYGVIIPDFAANTYTVYQTFNTAAISALAPVDLATQVTDYYDVSGGQYINARVAQVSNGTINVDIGQPGAAASAASNRWTMAAKQSELFTASGSGHMNWTSNNRITFDAITPLYGDRLAYTAGNVATWGGAFTVTTLDGNTSSFNVTSLAGLQSYNDWLIDQLQNANLSPDSYNSAFNKAITLRTASVVYRTGLEDPDDEVQQSVGDRGVLSADGQRATASIRPGATLEVVNASNGAVRGSNGATITIDGKLASTGNTGGEITAIYLDSGSHGVNNGVINGNFLNQADGSGVDLSTVGNAGHTVMVAYGSDFTNNGVINVAAGGYNDALWLGAATAVNNGTINVGVTDASGGGSLMGVAVAGGDSFINNASGTIYLGRGPQNAMNDASSDTALNLGGGTIGIWVVENTRGINNGHIVIGSGVQNGTGMWSEYGDQTELVNNGTIDVNGRAQVNPAENVAMRVTNAGIGGLIGNAGTINLNGDNGTGLKITASDGFSASAYSTGAINANGDGDLQNDTHNTAVWVTGSGSGQAVANLSGPITLRGQGAVGVRAEGNATVNLSRDAVPQAGDAQYQTGLLTIGPDARINLPTEATYAVSGEYATILRYQDGASFNGAGLTLNPQARFSVGVMGSGTGTLINTNGATFNLGEYATGVLVEGGAQGTIDAATTFNMNSSIANAATVDGNRHDLSGNQLNATNAPDATTSLTNQAAINGSINSQIALIAQNQAQLINSGNISLSGDSATAILAYYGATVSNSGDISVSHRGNALYATGYTFNGDGKTPAVITNSGTLNVTGSNDLSVLPTHGVVASGELAQVYQNGAVNLYGSSVLAGEAWSGATLYLGNRSTLHFNSPNQTGYKASFDATIFSDGAPVDVSTAGSTLYRVENGGFLYPRSAAQVTLSAANTTGVDVSGYDSLVYGTDRYLVSGDGATAVRVNDNAEAIISNPITLNGNSTVGVAASATNEATVYASSLINGSGTHATALVVGSGARVDHQGQVDLTGVNSTGALVTGGNFINRGSVHVASGVGVDVQNGYGQYVPIDSQMRVDDGIALWRVGNGSFLKVYGDGQGSSVLAASGTADALLLDSGADGIEANDIILSANGSGSVINNRAGTSNISLQNVRLEANGSNGIRSATSFDPGGSVYLNLTGGGTGYLFANNDGSTTSNDLVIGPGYTINVNGSGTAVRANTRGQVLAQGTIIINDANGGSAIVTSTASEVINQGAITSYSTVAPIIDLRGGETLFINQGNLSAPNPETVVVAGGASNDQIALLGGNVVGDVNTGNGSDTLMITGGTLNGNLTMGSGVNNQALVQKVSLANTGHITSGGGSGSTLSLSEIAASGGSFASDDLSKGVNLGDGWSTINFVNSRWALTGDLKLAHSTITIDSGSTLLAGNGVNPLLAGASSDSLVVNNAGTLDLTNGGGTPGNVLTIDGTLASSGGQLTLTTDLDAGGALSQQRSDTLRVNGDVSGTTLIAVTPTAASTGALTDRNRNGAIAADEGISLAQVSGNASTSSFALKGGYLAAGPWQYSLYRFAPGSSDASQRLVNGSGSQFWDYRLANTLVSQGGDTRPAVTPQVPSYLSAPVGLAYYSMAVVDDLHKRLGELRQQQSTSAADGGEMFLRYIGSNLTYKSNRSFSGYGYDADLDYSAVQLGGNLLHLDGAEDSLRAGVAYTRGNARIRPHAADGYSSTNFDNDSLALYATWLRDSGFYLDGALSWDWHRGETDIARQKKVATLKGQGWSASLESGYPLALGGDVRLEPQAQLMYLRLDMDNLTDADGSRVRYDNYDQTIGRIGARLDRRWQDQGGREYTPYLRANYIRGWGGAAKTTVSASDADISQQFTGGRFGQMAEVGLGGTAGMTKDLALYAEADYRKAIDGNGSKGWRYNAGVRWSF